MDSVKIKQLNLENLRATRQKWLTWKNISPLRQSLDNLPNIETKHKILDAVEISGKISDSLQKEIYDFAKELRPWRKGPFKLFDTFIDSEWQSFIKYNLLEPHLDIKDKKVADIGCNNGYYMFRLLNLKPSKIVGFDPSPHFKTQFDFINHFIKSDIVFEMLGVEHLDIYDEKFDVILCLGVLYHRSDPINTLKSLKKGLNKNGVLYLDTFMIDGDEDICLSPKTTYSKIPNIYFVPTIPALTNWCKRAGFKDVEILEIKETTLDEQRATEWILGESLGDFLDKFDTKRTIEGYPAPKRVYIKALL